MEAMMAMPEPEEKMETITIAKFGFRLVSDGEGLHSRRDLDSFSEEIIKPAFVRGSIELKKVFEENIEFKINRVENGSVVVEGSILATIIISTGIGAVATGLLTNIITHNLYSPNDKKQYEQLINKLLVISKTYTQESVQEFNKRKRVRTFITLPNSIETEVRDFYFDPVDFDEAKAAIDNAVGNYHSNTKKP